MKKRTNAPTQSNAPIRIIPIGGTDRVGMNATLIGQGDRYILVDLGAGFAPADEGPSPGGERIERLVPDLGQVGSLIRGWRPSS